MSTPLAYQCLSCQGALLNSRNLAIFIDATSSSEKTNVKKLYDVAEQPKEYLEGIGAYDFDQSPQLSRVGKMVYSAFEMAFAWNVEKNVKRAYYWLAKNYQEGDRIYLFGFSRGAYQVRALASMIHEVGLVRECTDERINQAYLHYLSIDPNRVGTRILALEFKKDFCWGGVRIHFVGVWDALSSLGLIKQNVHITDSASVTNACHLRHALSLDERRVKFIPEYFMEMNDYRSNVRRNSRHAVGDVKEVWFPGCHSDVGGINKPYGAGDPRPTEDEQYPVYAGNISLLWMKREAAAEGLVFKSKIAWRPDDVDFGKEDTLNPWWKTLEFLPIRHQVSFGGTVKHGWRMHLSRPRLVLPNQQIHTSVLDGNPYTPLAAPGDCVAVPTSPSRISDRLWTTDRLDEEVDGASSFRMNCSKRFLASVMQASEDDLTVTQDHMSVTTVNTLDGMTDSLRENLGWLRMKGTAIPRGAIRVVKQKRPRPNLAPHLDEGELMDSLTSLLNDRYKTLESLEWALDLLDSWLARGQTPPVHNSQWTEASIREQPSLDQFALTVIYDIISNFHTPEDLVNDARNSLIDILPHPGHAGFPRALHIVRFSAKHQRLRRRYVALEDVISALMLALERIARSKDEALFPLLIDSLRYVFDDNDQRTRAIDHFTTGLDGTGKTRLSLALEAKEPSHLLASLRLISSLARHQRDCCEALKPRIIELAQKERGPVGIASVEVLVLLNEPLPRGALFSNVLGYLEIALPPLDVEIGSSVTSLDVPVPLPPIFRVNSSGELDNKDPVMCELLQTINSRDTHQRTAATLTLLKLCRYEAIQDYCPEDKVLETFTKQMRRKETSLLAAYAYKTYLEYAIWRSNDFYMPHAAPLIVNMFDKGWFDGAVGRVEGSEILRGLMSFGNLRQEVVNHGILATLGKKLEIGDRHETRMSLICFDILWKEDLGKQLASIVTESLISLRDKDHNIQKKGARVLSSLALTEAGEQAIMPYVIEIMKMLLPLPHSTPVSRSRLFGPSAALYNLCKNETLREHILRSDEFACFQALCRNDTLYPRS